jgi:5-(carboxyamino)imidazole ribonucleotide mutase
MKPVVGIVMGSDSDLPIMEKAAKIMQQFNIEYELTIVSAHRTPERLMAYAQSAQKRGLKTIIAGAGGAAHLPGMLASITNLPVIGVPILSSNSIQGWDSVLSILQMPAGVPVATVALNGAENAGLLAAQIIGLTDKKVQAAFSKYKNGLEKKVAAKVKQVANSFPNYFDK